MRNEELVAQLRRASNESLKNHTRLEYLTWAQLLENTATNTTKASDRVEELENTLRQIYAKAAVQHYYEAHHISHALMVEIPDLIQQVLPDIDFKPAPDGLPF